MLALGQEDRLGEMSYRGSLNGRLHASVDADDKHDYGLRRTGPKKTAPPAKGIGREEQEAETADYLDNAVDTGCEEGHEVAVQAQSLENLGRVIIL